MSSNPSSPVTVSGATCTTGGLYGASASGGGSITLTNNGALNSTITMTGGTAGLYANGSNGGGIFSTINANSGTSISTSTSSTLGALGANGGLIFLNGSNLTTTGNSANAAQANSSSSISILGGNVATSGTGSIGAYATGGGKVILNGGGVSTTGGNRANGAQADTNSSVSIFGGSITTGVAGNSGLGSGSWGVYANGANALIDLSDPSTTAITTYGSSSTGVYAAGGGKVKLNGDSVSTSGSDAYGARTDTNSNVSIVGGAITAGLGIGLWSNGANALIDLSHPSKTTISTAGSSNSHGVYATSSGKINLNGDAIVTTGNTANAAYAQTGGAVNLNNVTVVTSGGSANSVRADASSTVTILGGSLSAQGSNSNGLYALGAGALIDLSDSSATAIMTSGSLGHGAYASGGTIKLNGDSIATSGSNANGAYAGAGIINMNNVSIATSGNGANGARADASSTVTMAGGSITTGDQSAARDPTKGTSSNGVYATGARSLIDLSDPSTTAITTYGNSSSGAYATSAGTINLNSDAIVTGGSGANGVFASAGGRVNMTGGSIITGDQSAAHDPTKGTGSYGVYSNGNGTVINLSDPSTTAITTYGNGSSGASATNSGTVMLTNENITTYGNPLGANNTNTANGVQSDLNGLASMTSGSITTRGGFADGIHTAGGTVDLSDPSQTTITTYGEGARGGYAERGGLVKFNGDVITTSGTGADGADSILGGKITMAGGSVSTGVPGDPTQGTQAYGLVASTPDPNSGVNPTIDLSSPSKTTITTYGNDSIGVYAELGGTIQLNNDDVTTGGSAAHGLNAQANGAITAVSSNITTGGDGSIGALAGNGGTINLNGNIIQTNGAGSHGAAVSGPTSILTFAGINTITTTGAQAHGIAALDGGQLTVDTALMQTVTLTVKGAGSAVVAAIGTDAATGTASAIQVNGAAIQNGGSFDNTIGALAQNGGLVNSASGSSVSMTGNKVIGAQSTGAGSQVNAAGTNFAVTGDDTRGLQADNGGTLNLIAGTVIVTGTDAYGVLSTQGGATTVDGVAISTTGDGGYGIVVEGPTSTATLNGSNSVSTTGAGAHAFVALNGGQATVISASQTALGAKVSGDGSAVVAAIGTDGASSPTRSTVNIQGATLQNGGNFANTIGALALDGGLVNFTSGSGVTMNADGVIGTRSSGAGSDVMAKDATVTVNGVNARGAQADNGGTVTLDGGVVTAIGAGAYGVLSTQGGNAALNETTISTMGDGAYGAVVDGSSSSMNLTGTNAVSTNGTQAHAVVALNGGQLTINNGAVNGTVQGADSAVLAVIGSDATTGTASTINSSNAAVANSVDHTIGVLAINGGVANLSGGSVTLSGNTSVGMIATGNGSLISTVQGTTVDTTGSGAHATLVSNGGTLNISGSKVTAAGPNASALLLYGTSGTATFTNSKLSSTLSDALLVQGGTGTINLFDGTTTAAGTGNLLHAMADANGNTSNAVLNLRNVRLAGEILVESDGSNADVHLVNSVLTGKMTNAGAVTLDPSTWVVTGNSDVRTLALTNSVVAFQPPSSRNGIYKSLLVRSDYTSNNGTVVLNTLLNEGGPLANQFTNRLLIRGNASGDTVLRILPTGGGAFSGPAPAQSDHGISVVQVGGSSSANAFRLEHGYVTGGSAYQYGLYSFGPGSANGPAAPSQSLVGANNWDYRLINPFVSPTNPIPPECASCGGTPIVPPEPVPNPDARAALAPQVPSYLAAPTSLLNASLQDLDSLHRRLGEIRDDQRRDRSMIGGVCQCLLPLGAEFFARFIGGSFDYSSNRTFQGFGFDSKQNYAAAQFGGDVVVANNDEGTMRVGIVGTLGRLRYVPQAVDGPSQGRIGTSSLAITATYQRKSGWYFDGIVTGSVYEGKVSTTARGTVSPLNGTGYSASIEGGRPFGSLQGWTFEPQAQLIYQHMNLVDQVDADGIRVAPGQHDFGIARVGARLTRTMGEKNLFTPYLKVNLLQGIGTGGYETIGNQNFALGVYGTGFQAGAGGTFTLSQILSVYADGAWQQEVSTGGFKGWAYSAGLRLAF